LKWLDSQQPCSVVYVCLGSVCNLITSQLIKLGLGLEESKKPFIWVIRGSTKNSEELEKWISEDRYEERIKGRGLLIRGWAPQLLILSHPSVGGFLTHCGWNSIIESISAGVPMLTWPLFGDQFMNEKLVVQVRKIGVRVGVEDPMKWGEEEKIGVLVEKEDVKAAIDMLMDEGEEREERRKRARELGEMAKRAVADGGSSHVQITLLIQDIMRQAGVEEST
jgi:UDP-glucosyl transferase 73C